MTRTQRVTSRRVVRSRMCTQVNASDNGYRMLIERPPASSALGEHNDNEILAIILGGTVLATLSGFVNAVSVSGTFSVGVSHVTGSVTRMGVSSVSGRYDEFWEFTGLVLVFMFGAFVSGCIIRDRAFALGRSYGVVLVIEAIVLIIAAIVYEELKSFVSEYFMAFACGLQNAMTTSYSGAVLRTTHLSVRPRIVSILSWLLSRFPPGPRHRHRVDNGAVGVGRQGVERQVEAPDLRSAAVRVPGRHVLRFVRAQHAGCVRALDP